jgi:hypothetical protein
MALIINNNLSLWSSQELGMIQVVSHCPLTSEAQVSSQAFLYGICGSYSGTGKAASLCTPVFTQSLSICLHSTFIHPLPVLYNLKNDRIVKKQQFYSAVFKSCSCWQQAYSVNLWC